MTASHIVSVALNQRSSSTSGTVTTWMGDCLKQISHLGVKVGHVHLCWMAGTPCDSVW